MTRRVNIERNFSPMKTKAFHSHHNAIQFREYEGY